MLKRFLLSRLEIEDKSPLYNDVERYDGSSARPLMIISSLYPLPCGDFALHAYQSGKLVDYSFPNGFDHRSRDAGLLAL